MSQISKYWEKYKQRHKNTEKAESSDKQAYISFLEIQLQRVTQSVRTCLSFSDRIQTLQSQVNSSEEKLLNLSKLVKLQQNLADSQEEQIALLKQKINTKSSLKPSRSVEIETRLQKLQREMSQRPNEQSIASLVQEVKKTVQTEHKNMLKDISIDKINKRVSFEDQLLQRRLQELEEFRKQIEKYLNRKEIPITYGQSELNGRVKDCQVQIQDIQKFLVTTNEEIRHFPVSLKQFQDRLSSRVSFAIDRIGNLMQDYVYKQEILQKKMRSLQKLGSSSFSQIWKSSRIKSEEGQENISRNSGSNRDFKKLNRSLSQTRKPANRSSLSPTLKSNSSMPISPVPFKRQGMSVSINEKLKKAKNPKKPILKKGKKQEKKKSKLQQLYDELAAHRRLGQV